MLSARTKISNVHMVHMWARWLHHPCHLGGLQRPTQKHQPGCLTGPQRSARGQKSEMFTWPTCGQSGYITPAVLGVRNAQRGEKNPKWLRGPHVNKVGTSPLPSWGSPTLSWGTKVIHVWVAHMRAKWLHHPYRLGCPQRSARRKKSEMFTWPTCVQSGYITPTVLGVPNAKRGDNN